MFPVDVFSNYQLHLFLNALFTLAKSHFANSFDLLGLVVTKKKKIKVPPSFSSILRNLLPRSYFIYQSIPDCLISTSIDGIVLK